MRNKNNPTLWLWEFSKRVVAILLVIYIVNNGLSWAAMIYSGNYDALSVLITETNETFRVGVCGYLIKAGIENALKISKRKKKKPVDPAEGEQNT